MARALKLRVDSKNQRHTWVTLFSGLDREHLANCGQIVLLNEDLDAIVTTLFVGAQSSGLDFRIASLDEQDASHEVGSTP